MYKIKGLLFLIIFFISGFPVFAQTDNWRQYSSAMAGFAIKYPSDWRIEKEEAKGQVWHLTVNSPAVQDDDVWEHNSITVCSKPKVGSFEDLDRCAEHHLPVRDNKNLSEKILNLNGLNIRRLETKEEFRLDGVYFAALYSTKERDFKIVGLFRKIFNLDRMIPVFDQMLETFQPLAERSVVTYRNEKYDFALTYPVSWRICPITEKANSDEKELLILVPEGRSCNDGNYISISRVSKLSGNLMTGYELQGILKNKGFTKFNPFLDVSSAQAEKLDERYIYRESLFFTNFLRSYDLLKIFQQIETNHEDFQSESREILATVQRHLKQN